MTYFRPYVLHGESVLVYWAGVADERGFGFGAVHVLNSSYGEIYRVTLSEGEGLVSTFSEKPESHIDLQEAFVTERGTILVSAVNVTRVNPRHVDVPARVEWLLDNLIYEIDIATNRVLFHWSTLEHLEAVRPSESCRPVDGDGTRAEQPWDFIHINGIAPYGEGYRVSSNFMNALYSIGKDGKVQWRLNAAQKPSLPDSIIPGYSTKPPTLSPSLYNDAKALNETFISQSSELLLDLNLTSRTVSLNRKLSDPSDPTYTKSQGSYQSLPNGHVFISRNSAPKLEEYDGQGRCIMKARIGLENYVWGTHTDFRLRWTGSPSAPPGVVACLSRGATRVYVSWNGATDVRAWDIWAGNQGVTGKELQYVVTVDKDGFETETRLEGIHSTVMVEAVGRPNDGRRSEAVRVQQTC